MNSTNLVIPDKVSDRRLLTPVLNVIFMAKRLVSMEVKTIHNDLNILKKQMGEVILILGGSASFDYKGMRADVKDLKVDVSNIKDEIEKIKRQDQAEKTKRSFLSIRLDTIPQRIVAIVAFIAVLISIFQGIKSLFHHQ